MSSSESVPVALSQKSKTCLPSEAVVQWCSVKKGVLRNFAEFTEKPLCQSLFFNKVAGLKLY